MYLHLTITCGIPETLVCLDARMNLGHLLEWVEARSASREYKSKKGERERERE